MFNPDDASLSRFSFEKLNEDGAVLSSAALDKIADPRARFFESACTCAMEFWEGGKEA